MRALPLILAVGLLVATPGAAALVGTVTGTNTTLVETVDDTVTSTEETLDNSTLEEATNGSLEPLEETLDDAALDEATSSSLEPVEETLDDAALDETTETVATLGGELTGTLLVGAEPGQLDAAEAAVTAAGGAILLVDETLEFLRVEAPSVGLSTTLTEMAGIAFIESENSIRSEGAQWNGAQWNGAQWNGAQWNGAQWNTANDAPDDVDDPGRVIQWGLTATQTPGAWTTTMGERSAKVCVLDSGIAWDHPDLAGNMWTGPNGEHGHNAIDRKASAYDDGGHGTHVAGIVAAEIGNGEGVAGVGNVRLMASKVLDGEGRGKEGDLAVGIAWCATKGADVALMALSVDEWGPTLERAVQFAAHRDVLLVASAGNTGPCSDCVAYPARHDKVMAVSAVGVSLGLAPFSSSGSQVDIAAPGVEIASTFPGGGYVYGSGSSQAAAYVAGAAALLRDANPGLSAGATRSALTESATDIGVPGKDSATGHGLLNTKAALGA